MTDPYRLLGVDSTASTNEIRAAFRRAANESHPDHRQSQSTGEAEARMSAVNDAWWTLRDPARRSAYDARRVVSIGRSAVSDPNEADRIERRSLHRDHARLFVIAVILASTFLLILFVIAMS